MAVPICNMHRQLNWIRLDPNPEPNHSGSDLACLPDMGNNFQHYFKSWHLFLNVPQFVQRAVVQKKLDCPQSYEKILWSNFYEGMYGPLNLLVCEIIWYQSKCLYLLAMFGPGWDPLFHITSQGMITRKLRNNKIKIQEGDVYKSHKAAKDIHKWYLLKLSGEVNR